MPLDTNNPNAVRAYSMDYETQLIQDSFFWRNNLVKPAASPGQGAQPAIVLSNALGQRGPGQTGAGWQQVIPLWGALEGYWRTGNQPIDGAESVPKSYSDIVQLNVWRKPAISPGPFSEQIGLRPHRDIIKQQMDEAWPVHFDNHIIAKLAGVVGDGTVNYFDPAANVTSARDVPGSLAADGNDLRAPSAGRYVFPGTVTASSGLTVANTLSLQAVDKALLQALTPVKNSTNKRICKPLMQNGVKTVVLLADYACLNDLMEATGSRFYLMQQALTQGGKDSALSTIMPDLMAVYTSVGGCKVLIVPHPNLPRFNAGTVGPDGTAYAVKTVRNLLLFQHAGHMVVGKDTKDLPLFNLYEEMLDGGGKLRVTASSSYGFQKTAFSTTETGTTREDWGTVALDVACAW
jgi:hypothetical protein